jgi:Positive regulator of sigma E activity
MKSVETAAICEVANVKKVYGDYMITAVLYSFYCDSDCEHCSEKCIETTKILRVKNTVGAKEGDRVILCMPNRMAFFISLLVFVAPCFLLMSLFMFTQIFVSPIIFLLIGIFALTVCLLFLKIMDGILEKTGKCKISAVKILKLPIKSDKIDK